MLVLANGCWKPGELQHESHGCAEPDRVMTNIDMTEAGIQRDGQKDVTGTGTVTGTEKNRRHVKIFEVPNCKSCSVDVKHGSTMLSLQRISLPKARDHSGCGAPADRHTFTGTLRRISSHSRASLYLW